MNRKYYDCFSIRLVQYLRDNNVEPLRAKTHHKTNKTIWVFELDDNLSKLLKEWTARGKKNKQLTAV